MVRPPVAFYVKEGVGGFGVGISLHLILSKENKVSAQTLGIGGGLFIFSLYPPLCTRGRGSAYMHTCMHTHTLWT